MPQNPETAVFECDLLDEKDTEALGRAIGDALKPGDLVLLEGDLGAGKTCLVRAAARILGVPSTVPVTSPTFNLIHDYPGKVRVIHADFYRLKTIDEVVELGLDDCTEHAVAFVEWGERFVEALDRPVLLIRLTFRSEGGRSARLEAWGTRGSALLDAVQRKRSW